MALMLFGSGCNKSEVGPGSLTRVTRGKEDPHTQCRGPSKLAQCSEEPLQRHPPLDPLEDFL